MKLSEAILFGAMLKPQDHKYFRDDSYSCALGAACDALGVPDHGEQDYDFGLLALDNEYPHMTEPMKCPACSLVRGMWRRWRDEEYDLGDVIVHLNDDHKWTRQRIAAWVATIEPATLDKAQSADAVDPALASSHGTSTREK